MSTQHTPGPWAHRNGRIFAADRENLTIAHVARSADGDYSPANGDVLAAAPELLAALRRMVDHDQHLIDAGVLRPYVELDAARAAIAKAEGKS